MTADLDHATRQIASEEFVRNFARALWMTPAGWLVVVAMAWSLAPRDSLILWLAVALVVWLVCVVRIRRVVREGIDHVRHRRSTWGTALLDGAGWGLLPLFLMGHDPTLDGRLAAVHCGVIAVTLGIYITEPRALALHVAGTWVGLLVAWTMSDGLHWSILFGLAVMHGLTLSLLPPITDRVVRGIYLQQANARLAEQLGEHLVAAEEEAATDPLTGVLNRRALERVLDKEIARADSAGMVDTCVLVLDLDHFKAINDTHGHAAGDEALRAFAARIRVQLRQTDHLARMGGEEFVVVLPGAPQTKAVEIAERLRAAVAEAPLVDAPRVRATVSIGIARRYAGETAASLLARADAAAYAAKRDGRNRVVLAGD